MTEEVKFKPFSFEPDGKEYDPNGFNEEEKIAYIKLLNQDQKKNDFIANANQHVDELEIVRLEYANRLKTILEKESKDGEENESS